MTEELCETNKNRNCLCALLSKKKKKRERERRRYKEKMRKIEGKQQICVNVYEHLKLKY